MKGHQDDILPYIELSRQAQLNVKADTYATNYLRNGKIVSYDELCANPASFYLEDHIINRDFKHQMRSASQSPELCHYMIGKFEWHPNTPDLIWWYLHGKSISIFLWLHTCEQLHMYNKSTSDQCHSCVNTVETHSHLLKCTCYHRAVIKDHWLTSLDSFLMNKRYTKRNLK